VVSSPSSSPIVDEIFAGTLELKGDDPVEL
jgi:hypothetical protein